MTGILWKELFSCDRNDFLLSINCCDRKFIFVTGTIFFPHLIPFKGKLFLWQEFYSYGRIYSFDIILFLLKDFFLWQKFGSCQFSSILISMVVPTKNCCELLRFCVNLVARLTVIIPPCLYLFCLNYLLNKSDTSG